MPSSNPFAGVRFGGSPQDEDPQQRPVSTSSNPFSGVHFGDVPDAPHNAAESWQQFGDRASGAFDSAGQWAGDTYKKLQGNAAGRFVAGAMTVGGKVLQPFAAPQQLLFGAVKSLEDLAHGDGAEKAWNDLKGASKAALGFFTGPLELVGLPHYNGGMKKEQGDVRDHMVMGHDLFKEFGAPDWLAKWGGVAVDFFVDVPVIGKAAKLAKLDKVGGVGMKFDNVLRNGTDLQKAAAHLIAAPMSVAPLPHLTQAIPAGTRNALAQRIGSALESARTVKKTDLGSTVGLSPAELLVSREGRMIGMPSVDLASLRRGEGTKGVGLPDDYANLERKARQVKASVALKLMDAGHRVMAVTGELAPAARKEYQQIVGKIVDFKSPSERAHWVSELNRFAQVQGKDQAWLQKVHKSLDVSTQADVFAAENMHAVGLMSKEELNKYQNGEKGHLRRMFGLFENPQAHIERLRQRDHSGFVNFDDQKLVGALHSVATRPNSGIKATGQTLAQDIKAALGTPGMTPAIALADVVKKHGMSESNTVALLNAIGGEYHRKLGIHYKQSDALTAQSLMDFSLGSHQGFGGAGGIAGGNSSKPLGQRHNLADYQLEALGEINDHMTRIQRQADVVGKVISRRAIVQGYHQLMQRDGVILESKDMGIHSMQSTGGWRGVDQAQAMALGIPELKGKFIPAIFHRRLMEIATIKEPSVASALWDWTTAAWRRSKLASPAAMARNLASGVISAGHFGVSGHELLQGAIDYTRLARGASKGDGILDVNHAVNGITMKELADHGEFFHNTIMSVDVQGPLQRFEDAVANSQGSPFQKLVAGMMDYVHGAQEAGGTADKVIKGAGLLGDIAGLGTGPVTKFFADKYGMVDTHVKGSIYMALRKKGMSAEKAARHADEALFNYEDVPYVVDLARKMGIAGLPFASYQVLSAGRFVRNLYHNPYSVARYYRVPNSVAADQSGAQRQNEYYASPDYIKNSLWIPVGKDQHGVPHMLNLASILPESPVWDMANSDNVTQFEPPILQLYRTIISGQGYQGRATYLGGKSLDDTKAVNPDEAVRGILKSAWQFGATPWAPGQPMTERLVKSLVSTLTPADKVASPGVQALLKITGEGPLAAGWQHDPVAPQPKGSSLPQDSVDAMLRFLGVTLTNIQPDIAQPGSGRSNLQKDTSQKQLIDSMERSAMQRVTDPRQKEAVKLRYNKLRLKIKDQRDQQMNARKAVK